MFCCNVCELFVVCFAYHHQGGWSRILCGCSSCEVFLLTAWCLLDFSCSFLLVCCLLSKKLLLRFQKTAVAVCLLTFRPSHQNKIRPTIRIVKGRYVLLLYFFRGEPTDWNQRYFYWFQGKNFFHKAPQKVFNHVCDCCSCCSRYICDFCPHC